MFDANLKLDQIQSMTCERMKSIREGIQLDAQETMEIYCHYVLLFYATLGTGIRFLLS